MEKERSYRGISARAAVGYLERLGGEAVDERTVEGDGWRVRLEEQKVSVGATLKLNEVTVTFEGDEAVLEPLIERFSQKAIRAGG
ncbi:MAG: hypothetical protein PPP58_11815 [Natronomonas sp.]